MKQYSDSDYNFHSEVFTNKRIYKKTFISVQKFVKQNRGDTTKTLLSDNAALKFQISDGYETNVI